MTHHLHIHVPYDGKTAARDRKRLRSKDSFQQGAEESYQAEQSSKKKFPVGSRVKVNSVGAPVGKVTGHRGNIIMTTAGDIHVTKAVMADSRRTAKDSLSSVSLDFIKTEIAKVKREIRLTQSAGGRFMSGRLQPLQARLIQLELQLKDSGRDSRRSAKDSPYQEWVAKVRMKYPQAEFGGMNIGSGDGRIIAVVNKKTVATWQGTYAGQGHGKGTIDRKTAKDCSCGGARTPKNTPANRDSLPEIKAHKMYTASDYVYLRRRGYSDAEIVKLWDRDASQGKGPLNHQKKPDAVGLAGR